MPEWPGYTVPTSGSSQNDGTPLLSSYTNREAALQTQYAAQGADISQQPPQYYGNVTAQSLDPGPERHNPPTAPTGVAVVASGTSGTVRVNWTASTQLPSQGYRVDVIVSGAVVQTKLVPYTAVTTNVPGMTVGASATAIVTALGAWVTAPSTASAAFTVV